jgi:hypothetical protein
MYSYSEEWRTDMMLSCRWFLQDIAVTVPLKLIDPTGSATRWTCCVFQLSFVYTQSVTDETSRRNTKRMT